MANDSTCRHCGAAETVLDYQGHFNVVVCSFCVKKHEKLIYKSNAKAMYLLSDSDMHKLGYLEKQNPHNQKFANMKQYLTSQVEEVAIAKHGSLYALEEAKRQRMQAKLEQRSSKRQAAELQEDRRRRHEEQLQATLDKYADKYACETTAAEGRPGGDDEDDDTGGGGGGGRGQATTHESDDPDAAAKRTRRFAAHLADVEVEEL